MRWSTARCRADTAGPLSSLSFRVHYELLGEWEDVDFTYIYHSAAATSTLHCLNFPNSIDFKLNVALKMHKTSHVCMSFLYGFNVRMRIYS